MQPLFAVSLADGVTVGTELLPQAQVAHRTRLLDLLDGLPDDAWTAPTRCSQWTVHQVVRHVGDVCGYHLAVLTRALGEGDTLGEFDPNSTPDALLARTAHESPAETLDGLRTAFADESKLLAERIDEGAPDRVPLPLWSSHWTGATTHALWDNWLHERDIAVPLGRDESPTEAEVLALVGYSMYVATMPSLLAEKDIDVAVTLTSDHGTFTVELSPGAATVHEGGDSEIRGDAVTVAEAVTGRGTAVIDVLEGAPEELTWLSAFFNPR